MRLNIFRREKRDSTIPQPIKDDQDLMRYLQTDPDAREKLGPETPVSDILFIEGSGYRFAMRTYSIRNARNPGTELFYIGQIRTDPPEYRIM